jgi:sugar lactone lactonase YvrE
MKKLLDGGKFFEGPRWHEGHWWVSDLYSHRVLKITPEGQAETVAQVPNQPSGLGWMPDGSLLVSSMLDRKVMRLHPDGRFKVHADLTPYTGGIINDMVSDAQGRVYVGNLGFDFFGGGKPVTANIVMVDTDGSCRIVADNVRLPNGSVITPDGKTLIVAETFGASLLAFTINPDGTLKDRRVWAQIGKAPSWDSIESLFETDFGPDGIALDAQGHVWVADAFGGRTCRIAPGGKIVDTIKAPNGLGLYACALGGADGKTMLLCTAPDHHAEHRKAKSEGALYTCRVK